MRVWQVGTLLPMIMAGLFLCDVGFRFLPIEIFAFRTFEPALNPAAGKGTGGFIPNRTVRMHHAYGDLAAMGNSRRLRQYHDEEFRADQFGFRNGSDVQTPYGGMVLGDSFVVSSAVPENQTLAAVLTGLAGVRFYNSGWSRHLTPAEVRYMAANLRIESGTVVCELVERIIRVGVPPLDDSLTGLYATPAAAEQAAGSTTFLPWLTEVREKLSPTAISPLQILAQKLVKRFQNGTLQPNPYWNLVLHERLRNGDDMLFLKQDADPVVNMEPLIASWTKYLDWYNGRLKARNLKLIVLLVPNKLTVYGPLATPPSSMDRNVQFLQEFEERTRALGIPVVNMTSEFREAAAEGSLQHEYLYWRDDTHWNAAGIDLAAKAVWRQMQVPKEPPLSKPAADKRPFMSITKQQR